MIAACRDAGVPFKCTAGLHHAMRRGEEHGFLNILAATTRTERAAGGRARGGGRRRPRPRAPDRSLFTTFGSCSWREPVDDLEALGLLA